MGWGIVIHAGDHEMGVDFGKVFQGCGVENRG